MHALPVTSEIYLQCCDTFDTTRASDTASFMNELNKLIGVSSVSSKDITSVTNERFLDTVEKVLQDTIHGIIKLIRAAIQIIVDAVLWVRNLFKKSKASEVRIKRLYKLKIDEHLSLRATSKDSIRSYIGMIDVANKQCMDRYEIYNKVMTTIDHHGKDDAKIRVELDAVMDDVIDIAPDTGLVFSSIHVSLIIKEDGVTMNFKGVDGGDDMPPQRCLVSEKGNSYMMDLGYPEGSTIGDIAIPHINVLSMIEDALTSVETFIKKNSNYQTTVFQTLADYDRNSYLAGATSKALRVLAVIFLQLKGIATALQQLYHHVWDHAYNTQAILKWSESHVNG